MTAHLALWMALAASASPQGVVAGRVAIFEGTQPVSPRQVQGALREPLGLSLRQGLEVVDARLDDEGFFVARAPPGRYRVEYLSVGDRAEFLVPQEVEVRPGALTCAGTLSITVTRMEALGTNSGSKVSATDDCAKTLPRLKRLAGWSGPEEVRPSSPLVVEEDEGGHSWISLLLGLRAEGAVGEDFTLRAWYVLPLKGYLGDHTAIMLDVAGARLEGPNIGVGTELLAGAGVNLFGLLELHAQGGYQLSLTGGRSSPVLAGVGRVGIYAGGLNARMQWSPVTGSFLLYFGLDLAPFAIVGSLL